LHVSLCPSNFHSHLEGSDKLIERDSKGHHLALSRAVRQHPHVQHLAG
jgi:hypothetical protein